MNRRLAKIFSGIVVATVALFAGAAQADDLNHFQTADGLLVYYGVVPVAQLGGFPEGSPEALAHGRIPKGRHLRHLVVAVYDADSMNRITDAKVTARVGEPGLGWVAHSLPPTELNGATTYCGYFYLVDSRDYMIDIDVQRSEAAGIVTAEFRYNSG